MSLEPLVVVSHSSRVESTMVSTMLRGVFIYVPFHKKDRTSISKSFSLRALVKVSGRDFSEKTLKSRISQTKLLTIKSLLTIVEPGHRAIKFNSITGVGETTYREGYNLKLPLLERPIIYDVRTHPKSIKSATGSKGKLTTPP